MWRAPLHAASARSTARQAPYVRHMCVCMHVCAWAPRLRTRLRLAAVQAELELVRSQVAAQQAKVSDLGMQAEAVRQRKQLLQVRS